MAGRSDRQYLKLRGNVWWLNYPIPADLRPHFLSAAGKPRDHIVESLRTPVLPEANRIKHARIAYWNLQFKQKAQEAAGTLSPDIARALHWRETLKAANDARLPDSDESEKDILLGQVEIEAERIERQAGPEAAQRWAELASHIHRSTLRTGWNEWMAQCEFTPGTRTKYTRILDEFLGYLKQDDAFADTVTRKVALGYVDWLNTQAVTKRGTEATPLAYETKKARITALSSFWADYLEHKEYVPFGSNPWRSQKITGQRKSQHGDDDTKRPYTEDEIVALLNGPELQKGAAYTKALLLELYTVGFYTGARLDEICSLTLRDIREIEDGYLLKIRKAKTKAGQREIPVLHPIPVAVLKRLIVGRTDPDAQLWASFKPGGPDDKLSWHPQKALGRYRDSIGLGTETDFHSTRRNFTTHLESCEVNWLSVQRYVGHATKDITSRVYSRPTAEGMRAVASAIRYSANIEEQLRMVLRLEAAAVHV